MRLQERIKKIEAVAREEAAEAARVREQRIDNVIAYMAQRGYVITREEVERDLDLHGNEMKKLRHLPPAEQVLQARINVSIFLYRRRTGASEEQAIAALSPHIPELRKRYEQPTQSN